MGGFVGKLMCVGNSMEFYVKLLTRECNKCLEPFTLYPYDLLCSLYDYDCMALAIENCLLDGGQLK